MEFLKQVWSSFGEEHSPWTQSVSKGKFIKFSTFPFLRVLFEFRNLGKGMGKEKGKEMGKEMEGDGKMEKEMENMEKIE